jgi:hypothetical protein
MIVKTTFPTGVAAGQQFRGRRRTPDRQMPIS